MHQVLNDSPYCQLIFDIPAVCLFKTNYVYAKKIVNISINQLKTSLKHIYIYIYVDTSKHPYSPTMICDIPI